MYQQLLKRYKLISNQIDKSELEVILHQLELALLNQDGAVVEFGCYSGTTSLFIRRLMNLLLSKSEYHVYDSFAGLPDKSSNDVSSIGSQFILGELAASKKQLLLNFKKANLKPPIIHKSWFSNLAPSDVPDDIQFAYLDGDYYQSIIDSLKLIWPKLTNKSVVVIDDYSNPALPGVEKAITDWAKNHRISIRTEKSLAIVKKL